MAPSRTLEYYPIRSRIACITITAAPRHSAAAAWVQGNRGARSRQAVVASRCPRGGATRGRARTDGQVACRVRPPALSLDSSRVTAACVAGGKAVQCRAGLLLGPRCWPASALPREDAVRPDHIRLRAVPGAGSNCMETPPPRLSYKFGKLKISLSFVCDKYYLIMD
jgi:hypothetical protein